MANRTRDQSGMVLFISLTLLSLLVALAVGALVAVRNDFKITANLRVATAAFYWADSGIEWAKDQLGRADSNPPVLDNLTHSSSTGSFAVSFSRPVKLTPMQTEVEVRSIGRLGNASQLIEARLSKLYDLADAALGFRGESGPVHFDGGTFLISGQDHETTGGLAARARKPRPAVSVSSSAWAVEIGRSLRVDQTANIVGARPAPAITRSDYTPVDMLAGLAADLCRSPAARNVPIPAIGLNLADQSWGDRLSPQMRCLNGVAGSAEVVSLGGIAGSGILVIQDAAVVASGSFRWEGLVLVSGANVGFAVTGEQNTDIVGALLINERAAASERTLPSLALRGAARILYSHTALSVAANLIPDEILATSYAALPSTVSQSYWRVIGR